MQTDTLEKWTRTVDCSDSVNSLSLTRARRGPSGRQRDSSSLLRFAQPDCGQRQHPVRYTHHSITRAAAETRRAGGVAHPRRAPAPAGRARAAPSPGTNRIDRPRLTSPVGRLEALRAAPGSRAAPVRSLRRGLLRHGRRDALRYATGGFQLTSNGQVIALCIGAAA